jgi:Ca2+-transporting ATPase
MPVHIVFLELIIDPACSTAFESEIEEPNVMRRRPRDPRDPIFGLRTIVTALLQGTSALLIVAAVFFFALRQGQTELHARALAFTTLIVANLALIWTNRSWTATILQCLRLRNVALWWVTGGALTLLTLVLAVPLLRELFRVSTLGSGDLSLCVVAGLASILWFEAMKLATPIFKAPIARPN